MLKKILNFIKKKKWLIVGFLVAGMVIFLLVKKIGAARTDKNRVKTASAKIRDLTESVVASGEIKAEEEVTLKFQASGQLNWVGVKKGDYVQKWQAIASLNKEELEKNLKKELIDYMNERWDFEEDKDDYDISSDNLDKYTLGHEARRLLEKNQFNLNRAILDVEIVDIALKYAVLITPIEGIVTSVEAPYAGVNVTPATAEFVVSNPNGMLFQANIDETEIGKLKTGQKAILILDAYPEEEIEIEVYRIGFTSTTTSGGGTAFPVKVQLPKNTEEKFKLGMNGDLEVIIAERKNVLTIPFEAIREKNGEDYVFVQKDKDFEKQGVKTGFSNDIYTQIIEGITEGEKVAISGLKTLEKKR